MESLPTLLVPDDPETGAIERPEPPPLIQIAHDRLVHTSASFGVPRNPLSKAVVVPETFVLSPELPLLASNEDQDETNVTPVIVMTNDATFEPFPSLEQTLVRPETPRTASLSSKDYKAMAKRAALTAKLNRLAAGTKSVFDANMHDIAALGIGLELYFLLLKYLSWAFLMMAIVSLPALIVNYYGNGVTSEMVDPLQLAYASLGNQGVSPDIASDPSKCLPRGDIDCTGATVTTPFTSDPSKVAWIVTSSDAIYSFLFLLVYLAFRRRARQAIDLHQNEHLTPAKYAVFVRGLPSDATAQEILAHFNSRYDPTLDELYFPLWFGCCWGRRRRRVKHSLTKGARNCNVVSNLDHLWRHDELGHARRTKEDDDGHMYLGTWIAEVSVAHPTGGLLRTFLAMEALTRKIVEAQALVNILTHEKAQAEIVLQRWTPSLAIKKAKRPKSSFKHSDEVLLQSATKTLARLQTAMTKKTSKLKALKQANRQLQEQRRQQRHGSDEKHSKASSRRSSSPDAKPFDLNACECAFVVFNNLESHRRCLQDYRRSSQWLPHKYQPKALRFRHGQFPLIVLPAPEPSNILWENLEVTARSRLVRRSFTYSVTLLLLLFSGAIISAAQSAQRTFKDKAPPAGLCDSTLPQVFYATPNYLSARTTWELEWNPNATCTPEANGQARYHIAYSNNIINNITVRNPTAPLSDLKRCIDPCISEKSSTTCHTLPCFDGTVRDEAGKDCDTYLASHVLYCLCTAQLQSKISELGLLHGPKQLWTSFVPCRGFLTDYLGKNVFIVAASAFVVVVNIVLKSTLRRFAAMERHTSESAKASAVALKMFAAQFLNTAIIVLVVNAALSLDKVPVVGEVFRGKYSDFQRDWYPTVGMGITMTMLINAIMPQVILLLQLSVINPFKRRLARRKVRTQEKMDQLYAGPTFDLAVRYPTILNSVFVTLVFCGGSPVLLVIATLACTATYWLDKLSLLRLYSVKTAYDEALGETVLAMLPWALVAHLAFSTWMYGNTDLLQGPTLSLAWIFKLFQLGTEGATNTESMYKKIMAKATTLDPLGSHGFIVKVLHANVMLMFLLFVLVLVGILLSAVWARVLLPVLRNTIGRVLFGLWRQVRPLFQCCCCQGQRRKNAVKPVSISRDSRVAQSHDKGGGKCAIVAATIVSTEISTNGDQRIETTDTTNEATWASAEPLVQKSSVTPSAFGSSSLESAPVSPRRGSIEVILPEFTDIFRKSVGPKFRPDSKLGFKRESDRPSVLVRQWQEEAISNGLSRQPGDFMRTWEAIQAPVKTYAIEANAKYRLAVAELVAASKRALASDENAALPGTSSASFVGIRATVSDIGANNEQGEGSKDTRALKR